MTQPTFDVIVPQFVADVGYSDSRAELLQSSIASSSYSAWDAATTYAAGDYVIYQIDDSSDPERGIWKVFKSLQASNLGNDPYSEVLWWSDQGATEKWKMFDYYVNTATTDTVSDIVVDLHCRKVSSISFMNVQASAITIKIYDGSTLADKIAANLLATITIDLTQTIYDWFGYFFDDFDYVRDVSTPVDLYLYQNVVLEITFSKITGKDCYCGQCLPGRSYPLGVMQYGVDTGIQDFSKKDEDDFGNTYLKTGNYKKKLDLELIVEDDEKNGINSVLTQLRGTPTVWNGNNGGIDYDAFLLFGYFQDFRFTKRYGNVWSLNLELRGLI